MYVQREGQQGKQSNRNINIGEFIHSNTFFPQDSQDTQLTKSLKEGCVNENIDLSYEFCLFHTNICS